MSRCRISVPAMLFLVVVPCYAETPPPTDQRIEIAVAGDLIGPFHPVNRMQDRDFARVAELFRRADAGFANQEGSILDLGHFLGYPAAETGGGYPVQLPSIAGDIRDMGISLVSKANNHSTDYGAEGLLATLYNLASAGIVAGGAGLSDTEARLPVYLNTPKGALALVATASTFTPSSVAGPAVTRPAMSVTSRPRPGLSPLHVRQVRLLAQAEFQALQKAAGPVATKEGADLRIGDQVFRQDAADGTRWEMDPADEKAILSALADAQMHASLSLFSIHAHETAGFDYEPAPLPFEPLVLRAADEAPSPNDPRPADFEVELFHAAIDQGADLVIRHGPHVLGGIEIYKGKPIFYSLGSLFLDFGGRRVLNTPGGEKLVVPDSWYETVVPVCVFRARRLESVKLYPIIIEPEAGPRSGVPSLARGERARTILARLKRLSAAFGTQIEVIDEVGSIRVADR